MLAPKTTGFEDIKTGLRSELDFSIAVPTRVSIN
jgi:hypothetical protein